jgi:hypothetical protein
MHEMDETRMRRDQFAAAALTGILAADNGIPFSIAIESAVMVAKRMIENLDADGSAASDGATLATEGHGPASHG